MNGHPGKVEIFAPFGAAYEWMMAMLFRPFDVGRWLTIAFAAFLAGSVGGGGGNFGRLGRFGEGDWKYSATTHGNAPVDWSTWITALIVCGVLIALVLAVAWMWVSSRGRFIFTDCIVKNRAAIVEPWREFRREGNSYFLFLLMFGFGIVLLTTIFIVAIAVPLGLFSDKPHGAAGVGFGVLALIIFGFIWLVGILFFALVSHFMVPVMYRRRCLAQEAFLDVTKLIFANPVPFLLFVLFGIALVMALAVIGMLVACMTCCIGGLPYISTVLLLPAFVWLAAFKLFFLRQFGDAYDVWATSGVVLPVSEPSVPPPITPGQ
ncbi:MAG TPA: hypothetical protein VGH00_00855 [Chthoniobacterales bacterium]